MASIIGTLSINPAVTGSLLYLLTKTEDRFRLPIVDFVAQKLPAPFSIPRILAVLKVLFTIGLVTRINAKLNEVALSNWIWFARKNKWRWSSEVAVVTGGCMGLGQAMVRDLYAKGMRIAILDVADLPKEFENKSRIMLCKCDISSKPAIQEAAKTIREQFTDPTILINNAGIATRSSIIKTAPEKIEKLFQINTISHFYTVQEFMPSMIRNNKGHIMTVASIGSFASGPGMSHYCCTKASALAFQETLLCEVKHVYKTPDVLISTIYLNMMATPMTDQYGDQMIKNVKAGDIMSPEYISRHALRQIFECRGGQVILPDTLEMKIASIMRALPNWVLEAARDSNIRTSRTAEGLK